MFSLENKIALVTGAGSGIGASIAETFARAGARVFLADRDEAGARKTTANITEAGGAAQALKLDITSESDIAAAQATIGTRSIFSSITPGSAASGQFYRLRSPI